MRIPFLRFFLFHFKAVVVLIAKDIAQQFSIHPQINYQKLVKCPYLAGETNTKKKKS